jgi:hypothetical protein
MVGITNPTKKQGWIEILLRGKQSLFLYWLSTQSVTLVKHLVISQRGRGCSYNKWNINVVICVRHSQTYFSHQHSHIWYGVLIYIVWACLLGYNFPNRSVNGICSPFSNFLNAIFRISVQYFIFLGNLFLHLLIEHIHIL